MQSKHSQRQLPDSRYLLDDNYPKKLTEVVGSNNPTQSTFTVVQIRYWSEPVLGYCRTD